jgi:hypothetical protein
MRYWKYKASICMYAIGIQIRSEKTDGGGGIEK